MMRYGVIISSLDDVNMYLLIKIATIIKAVRFFSGVITAATKKTIKLFLKIIRFGMISTFISFGGDYYEYHDGKKKKQ